MYRLAVFFTFSAKLRAQDLELEALEPLKEYVTPQMATSVTASIISFVVIMVLNIVYERVAIWITDFGAVTCGLKAHRVEFLRRLGIDATRVFFGV